MSNSCFASANNLHSVTCDLQPVGIKIWYVDILVDLWLNMLLYLWSGACKHSLEAGHSIDCITDAGHSITFSKMTRRCFTVPSRHYALCDPVTLTIDLLM